jgi:hypothetical protein
MNDLERLATDRAEAREDPVAVVAFANADHAVVIDYDSRALPYPEDTAGDEWRDVDDNWRSRVAGVVPTD